MQIKCPMCGALGVGVLLCCCPQAGGVWVPFPISSLPPSSSHHLQARKGVNAACGISGDVVTPRFPVSSINLLAGERMPGEEEGARSKGIL